MARRKKSTKHRRKPAPHRVDRNHCRIIILIDQEPLRKKVSAESRRLMAALDRERAKLQQFERQDRPAFDRWMATHFGPLQTELREMGMLISEKSLLVAEIEDEMFFGNCRSYHVAWRRVMDRRVNPGNGAASDSPDGAEDFDDPFDFEHPGREPGADADKPLDDRDAEELFREFLFEFLGVNPDSLDRRDYARMLREFKISGLGMDGSENAQRRDSARFGHADFETAPHPARVRLKELYRTLVRRLHPDVRADGDPNVTAVWHEVQTAYAAGDEARLETLLAFTDVRENRAGSHTSFSQWLAVIAELKAAINAVRRSLRFARKDRAWNFHQSENQSALERKVAGELDKVLIIKRAELSDLEQILESWSRPPVSRRRAKSAVSGQSVDRQREFQF